MNYQPMIATRKNWQRIALENSWHWGMVALLTPLVRKRYRIPAALLLVSGAVYHVIGDLFGE